MEEPQTDNLEIQSLPSFFGRSRLLLIPALVLLFSLGIGFRLINPTNPPLDVHAWRSMGSAVIARGMYYQMLPNADPIIREKAIQLTGGGTHDEPPITELLTAVSYLAVGGEHLWIFRLWTTFFWMVGGAALFALVRRLVSVDGAVAALAYYLLLPFANMTTRGFLPEPLLVMWILIALYCLSRWVDAQTWKWTILSGIATGMAILTKVFAVFPLGPAIFLLCLASFGLRRTVSSKKFWVMISFAVFIPAAYYIFPTPGAAGGYLETWVFPYLSRLKDITFYINWLNHINENFNLVIVLVAFGSTFLLEKRWRAMSLGLWIGYLLLGITVPELIYSHLYYSLPFIIAVAISLGPISSLLLGKIAQQGQVWKMLMVGAALLGIGYTVFISRKQVVANDYRAEPQKWQELAALIPGNNIVGITEDYGTRFNYFGWKLIREYPYSFDQDMGRMAGHEFDVNSDNMEYFLAHVGDCDYFVITMMSELDTQPYLRNILYSHYQIFAQSDWYIVFDLTNHK